VAAQDERLTAIAAAAATVLRRTPYHVVRAGDVAAAVRLPGPRGRSAVWLYNEVHNRRVLVALAAAHAWREFAGRANWSPLGPIESVTAARSAAVAALGLIVAFHRAEQCNDVEMAFTVKDASGREQRSVFAFTFRYFFRYEVEHLLARSGFLVTGLFGDFDRSTLRDDSPEMIFVAETR